MKRYQKLKKQKAIRREISEHEEGEIMLGSPSFVSEKKEEALNR